MPDPVSFILGTAAKAALTRHVTARAAGTKTDSDRVLAKARELNAGPAGQVTREAGRAVGSAILGGLESVGGQVEQLVNRPEVERASKAVKGAAKDTWKSIRKRLP